MSVTKKTYIGTIDCTPSWRDILKTLLILYENGGVAGRSAAIEELQRMAELADLYVKSQKLQVK